MLIGTIVNCITIVVGSLIGLLLSRVFTKSSTLAKIPDVAMKAISLCVIYIGLDGALDCEKPIVMLLSMIIGAVIGTVIDIDGKLERLGSFVERKFIREKTATGIEKIDEDKPKRSFSKGFVSTTLTCCVGAMAITGALQSGLSGGENNDLLFAKSVLDFITALVFSSTFGIGAMLAAVPVFIYQGAIELLAGSLSGILQNSINEVSAVGSLVVMGLGLNMVGATKLKVANFLPAVFLPMLFCLFL